MAIGVSFKLLALNQPRFCSVWAEKEQKLEQFYLQRTKQKRKFEVGGEMNIWVSFKSNILKSI